VTTVGSDTGGNQVKAVQTVRPHAGKVVLAVVAGLLLATAWTFIYANPAAAQADPYSSESPSVLPTRISNDKDPEIQPNIQGNPPENRDENVLPFTGGDVVLFAVIGAAALGIGFVLVRRTRTDN
jgi:hypothetical protein